MALGSALFMALVAIQLRSLGGSESVGATVFYFSVFSGIFMLPTVPTWAVPDAIDLAVLITLGLVGGVGQILLTQAYRYAEASVVAPFEYTTILWSLLLGYMFFAEIPAPTVVIGVAVVIVAGVFVILRERRLGLERARAREVGPPT